MNPYLSRLHTPVVAIPLTRFILTLGTGVPGRLEYSTRGITDLAALPQQPDRQRMSIVANDWDDDTVITVKGPGLYSAKVLVNAEVPRRVQTIRDKLREIAVRKFEDNTEGYAFGLPGKPNAGTIEKLSDSLTPLAVLGGSLFDKLLLGDDQDKLRSIIDSGADLTIHVAHILREKVIPWGVLYDRPYDKDKQVDDQGNEVAFGLCSAALPYENGVLPVRTCFGPRCLLEGYPGKRITDDRGRTLLPETVVCPLHFWGFRHVIEVPPQQTPSGKERSPMWDRIPVDGRAKLATGVNCSLSLYQPHLKELASATTKIPAAWHDPAEYARDKIIAMLQDTDLSGIYFYCHAVSDGGDGDPELIFRGPNEGDRDGVITPDALRGKRWTRHPLVFLNGCSTAAYSPEAMSPFFKKLIDDRDASGIIGTEIAVREQLAVEMARRFFKLFLDLTPAGDALLQARRALLAQNNPLGLVYTLYASADLKLTK
jgi:hypothetical protein